MMKFRNFGKKSLTELDELVALKGLTFGMDTSKYKLDKEQGHETRKKIQSFRKKGSTS